jgi:hypothetical protein
MAQRTASIKDALPREIGEIARDCGASIRLPEMATGDACAGAHLNRPDDIAALSLHFDPDGRIARERLGLCADGAWWGGAECGEITEVRP